MLERGVGEEGEDLHALAAEELRLLLDHHAQGERADEALAVGAVEPVEVHMLVADARAARMRQSMRTVECSPPWCLWCPSM